VATEAQRKAFALGLRRAREDQGLSQAALGKSVGRSRGAVWQWEEGRTAPEPELVTELEQLLETAPGQLGRWLGYVDVAEITAAAQADVIEAVQNDPKLGDQERELLVNVYRWLLRRRSGTNGTG
jgi:transcriptional regulator with XRE-family HTH domain